MAGSQGSAYNSNSGGKGYVLSKKVYLNKGDVIKAVVGERPSWSQNGSVLTVPGGNYSELYLNGVLQWRAGGGASEQSNNIAPTGVTSVQYFSSNPTTVPAVTLTPHWHSGNGMLGPTHANQFPTLYGITVPGGCYVGRHVHDSYGYTCPKEVCGGHMGITYEGPGDGPGGYDWHVRCDRCGSVGYRHWQDDYVGNGYDNSDDFCDDWAYACNNLPHNVWQLGCGHKQGEIRGSVTTTAGTCYTITSGVFVSPDASLVQEGNGVFTCSLSPQGTISSTMYGKHPIAYKGTKAELVLFDKDYEDKDYVAYFRR